MSDFSANDLPARVAVLEEIARHTKAALERIEHRFDTVDRRLIDIAREQSTNFRFTITLLIGWGAALLGVMAHGFHWI